MFIKFKPADHSRRTPAWLQAHTKENVVWQLAITVLYIGGLNAKHLYEERKARKRLEIIEIDM